MLPQLKGIDVGRCPLLKNTDHLIAGSVEAALSAVRFRPDADVLQLGKHPNTCLQHLTRMPPIRADKNYRSISAGIGNQVSER